MRLLFKDRYEDYEEFLRRRKNEKEFWKKDELFEEEPAEGKAKGKTKAEDA
jgi:hypothetical protein